MLEATWGSLALRIEPLRVGRDQCVEGGRVPAASDPRPGEQLLGPGLVLELLGAVELGVGDDEDIAQLGGRPDSSGRSGGDDKLRPDLAD